MKRLMNLLAGLFRKRQPAPVRVVVRLTVDQALDISRDYGYNAVDWQAVS